MQETRGRAVHRGVGSHVSGERSPGHEIVVAHDDGVAGERIDEWFRLDILGAYDPGIAPMNFDRLSREQAYRLAGEMKALYPSLTMRVLRVTVAEDGSPSRPLR